MNNNNEDIDNFLKQDPSVPNNSRKKLSVSQLSLFKDFIPPKRAILGDQKAFKNTQLKRNLLSNSTQEILSAPKTE